MFNKYSWLTNANEEKEEKKENVLPIEYKKEKWYYLYTFKLYYFYKYT